MNYYLNDQSKLETWFEIIAAIKEKYHNPRERIYQLLKEELKREIEEIYGEGKICVTDFKNGIGEVRFPFIKFSDSTGSVSSVNLFDIDELIIFTHYIKLRRSCKRAADLGANTGLHTIVLSRLGYETKSWEPDEFHFKKLKENLEMNKILGESYQKAVTVNGENVEFIKVHGNSTGSHIAGSKDEVYGEISSQKVKSDKFENVIEWADIVKIDVEGYEAKLLTSIADKKYSNKYLFVEIGNNKNAEIVYNAFSEKGVLYSQLNNWKIVEKIDQMPKSYKDGTLLIKY